MKQGDDVYVLNRNTRKQPEGATLIEADRYQLGDILKSYKFDAVIDVNSYTGEEITLLLDALPSVTNYVFISTSAVYPNDAKQPFEETLQMGHNAYAQVYGSNKMDAERILNERMPHAYILRPAYIYGPYNDLYREAFVFDCARNKRPFYIPEKGEMTLQFIHVRDLCRLVDQLLIQQPEDKIYNVGNQQLISVRDWVSLCYEVVDEELSIIEVDKKINPLQYFSFNDYQYEVAVHRQTKLIGETIDLKEGLVESWQWYQENEDLVTKQDYQKFIDETLK